MFYSVLYPEHALSLKDVYEKVRDSKYYDLFKLREKAKEHAAKYFNVELY